MSPYGYLRATGHSVSGLPAASARPLTARAGPGRLGLPGRGRRGGQCGTETKVVLVGEGTVGKTSLVAALRRRSSAIMS